MAQTGLRPCPFCGGDAYVSDDGVAMYMGHCAECNAELGWFASEETAIERWNRRIIILD